jgi:hypothetical protein
MPTGQGIWPAFWMLPTDEIHGGWPESGEIDIMENIGSQPSTVHGTLHFGNPWPDNSQTGGSYSLPGGQSFTDDLFHEFAIEKGVGVMRWIIDGVLFSTKTPDDIDAFWPFDVERYHFILNLAVGGNWPGDPDDTTVFPQTLEVDYVRVYEDFRPHLAGDRQVNYNELGVYSVAVGNDSPDTMPTLTWMMPGGATIVSGQGTASIIVQWFASGAVTVTPSCVGGEVLTMHVTVVVPPACTSDADCDDSNQCNGYETCSAGACVAGTALDCDDTDACTLDSCDPMAGGCLHDSSACSAVCGDGNCESGEDCSSCPSDCSSMCPVCAGNGASCGSTDDCCSNKCIGGSCRGG